MQDAIVLTGVVQGQTIVLDEKTILPEGYRVTLHLVLGPGEGLRLLQGVLKDVPPETVQAWEEILSEMEGYPVHIPGPEEENAS